MPGRSCSVALAGTIFSFIMILLLSPVYAEASDAFRKGPWLIYDNDPSSMTVMWQTNVSKPSHITWSDQDGYNKGEIKNLRPASDENIFSVKISGLIPGKMVSYNVVVDGEQQSGNFKSAPHTKETKVILYALGDSRSDKDKGIADPRELNKVLGALYRDVTKNTKDNNTLILDVGDFVNFGMTESWWNKEFFNREYSEIGKVLSSMPVMVCQGNHDGYYEFPPQGDPDPEGTLLRKYWPNLKNQDTLGNPVSTYSFDYGPVHVAVLDQYTLIKKGQEYIDRMFNWLTDDLVKNGKTFNILMFHLPAYAAGRFDHDSSHMNNDMMMDFMDKLSKLKQHVHLVLQAHNHYYSRVYNKKQDITYLTLGGAGAPWGEKTGWDKDSIKDYSKEANICHDSGGNDLRPLSCCGDDNNCKRHHYAKIEVNGNTMHVTVVNTDSDLKDYKGDNGSRQLDDFTIGISQEVNAGSGILAAAGR